MRGIGTVCRAAALSQLTAAAAAAAAAMNARSDGQRLAVDWRVYYSDAAARADAQIYDSHFTETYTDDG